MANTVKSNSTHLAANQLNIPVLFGVLWILVFVLYFPAAKAGFVSDFTGWLDQVQNHSFSEYIHRSNFKVVSLYQFTQLVTWVFYQLFGTHAWLWHLLFITLHVINACLACVIINDMLRHHGASHYNTACYIGAVLFCISPYISEVIVWEPSFHYLLGLLLLLMVLINVQRYIHTQKTKYIWYAALTFLLSTHSLEVFYITPWLVLSLALFYRYRNVTVKPLFPKLLLYFFLPILLLFILRLVEFRLLHGDWVSRVGSEAVVTLQQTGLGKAGKHLFHMLFLGRFISSEWHIGGLSVLTIKSSIYHFFDSTIGIVLFYASGLLLIIWGIIRFRSMTGTSRVMLLLLLWTGMTLLLIIPLWFDASMLIVCDRYTYFACLFFYMLLALVVWSIPNRYLRIGILIVFGGVNLLFTIHANRLWGQSSHVVNSLLENIPPTEGKITVLLNNPESMYGVPMIGSWPESEYKLMHNLLHRDKPLTGIVYDALSYNMRTTGDGAHVQVLNDSMVRVTVNQDGTWWWYLGLGGYSYENEDYILNHLGQSYELTVKRPIGDYLLLYQVGDRWKVVDVTKINEVQY